ncbi:MAG: hypothetical protein K6357_02405 [Elusimicrobiota bacterium]
MNIDKKIDELEKYIYKMGSKIEELMSENLKLKNRLRVIEEREKFLTAELSKTRDNNNIKQIVSKRLLKISKMIEKEIER